MQALPNSPDAADAAISKPIVVDTHRVATLRQPRLDGHGGPAQDDVGKGGRRVVAAKKTAAVENEKTAGFIAAKQAKLADEKFAAKAPPAVVAKEREQLAELEAKLAKGVATLAELKSRGPAGA